MAGDSPQFAKKFMGQLPRVEEIITEGFVLQRLQPKWTRISANDLALEMACNIVGLIYYLLVSSILLLI